MLFAFFFFMEIMENLLHRRLQFGPGTPLGEPTSRPRAIEGFEYWGGGGGGGGGEGSELIGEGGKGGGQSFRWL